MCTPHLIIQTPHTPRVNKNLKVALRVYHNQNQQTWDQNTHWFQLAFNTAFHQSVSTTSASLFFGCELQTPLDLQWNLTELTSNNANSPDVHNRWASILESLRRAREKRAERYCQQNYPNQFPVGDWVFYRQHHQINTGKKVNYKLLQLWSKPCAIEAFTSPVTVKLVDPKSRIFVRSAHITQLKRFFSKY